jgi:hypothetical protein
MNSWAPLFCLALAASCTPWLAGKADVAAAGAVVGVTSPASEKLLSAEEVSLIDAGVSAILSPDVENKLAAATNSFMKDLRAELVTTRDALIDQAKLRREVADLRRDVLGPETQAEVKRIVRASVDEALSDKTRGEIDTLIDSAEPHLQSAMDRLIVGATPKIEGLLNKTSSAAESDLSKFKVYFTWILAAMGLLLALIIALAILIATIASSHNKLSARVEKMSS